MKGFVGVTNGLISPKLQTRGDSLRKSSEL